VSKLAAGAGAETVKIAVCRLMLVAAAGDAAAVRLPAVYDVSAGMCPSAHGNVVIGH